MSASLPTVSDKVPLPKTRDMTPRQRVAVYLVGWTLGVLLVVTIILIVVAIRDMPSNLGAIRSMAELTLNNCLKSGCSQSQSDLAQKLLEDSVINNQWHDWWERVFGRASSLLVPLVTALFGYIFGTQQEPKEE